MKEALLANNATAQIIINAFPAPVFIVDRDVRVVDMNAAANSYFQSPAPIWGQRLCGDVLHCANVHECAEDCGQTRFCRDCVIRQSVGAALTGTQTTRRWSEMYLIREGHRRRVCFLISVAPFNLNQAELFFIVLEDVTEVAELRQLIPICASCGQARSGDNYWQSVQDYLRTHTAVQFSHGLCPGCVVKLYGESGKDLIDAEPSGPGPLAP